MIQELHMVRSKYKKNSGLNYFLVSSEIPVHVFVDHFVQSSDIGLSYRVIIGESLLLVLKFLNQTRGRWGDIEM